MQINLTRHSWHLCCTVMYNKELNCYMKWFLLLAEVIITSACRGDKLHSTCLNNLSTKYR